MQDFKKKFKLKGLTNKLERYRISGEGQTSVIKHPVTNVEMKKGMKATKEMMPEEREDIELDESAQELQDQALLEAEIERKKKRDEEREEYLSVLR